MFHQTKLSMMVLRCSSSFTDIHGLVKAASALGDVLVLSPKAVKTEKALEMAFFLARNAFEETENISSKLSNEAMLFLACEINFESALRKVGAASPDDFVLVSEKAIPSARLKKTLFLTRAQTLPLSEWGNKMGAYSEGELAIEKMALARIRN
ncbi:Uncharacterised protein [uncultured archaeon]|nr:Uncharacterised protein [uncultured archaeon]